MNGRPWSQPEISALLELAGDLPFPMLCRKFNRQAAQQGWPIRSPGSIRTAIYRHHGSSYPVGEWLTVAQAGLMLGGSSAMVRHWVRRGWLPARTFTAVTKPFSYVSRTDLRILARKRPALFGGVPEAVLNEVLCDEKLAEHISAHYPRRQAAPTPVRQVETGRRYPSIRAAALAAQVSYQAIQWALRTQKPIAGGHWQLANPRHQATPKKSPRGCSAACSHGHHL